MHTHDDDFFLLKIVTYVGTTSILASNLLINEMNFHENMKLRC
jgi:hypothetical protein